MTNLKEGTEVEFLGTKSHRGLKTKIVKVSAVKDRYYILHPDGFEGAAIPELKGINYGVNFLMVTSSKLKTI